MFVNYLLVLPVYVLQPLCLQQSDFWTLAVCVVFVKFYSFVLFCQMVCYK